jgi:hypothetical protein
LFMGAVISRDLSSVCLVTEFMAMGSLDSILERKEFPLDKATRAKFSLQAAHGIGSGFFFVCSCRLRL